MLLMGTEFLLFQRRIAHLLASCRHTSKELVGIPWEGRLTSWPGSEWGSMRWVELGPADRCGRGEPLWGVSPPLVDLGCPERNPTCHLSFLLPDLLLPQILS